jgi:hypothetical protein
VSGVRAQLWTDLKLTTPPIEKSGKHEDLDTYSHIGYESAPSSRKLSEDNPEQITKLPERFTALLTPHPPARCIPLPGRRFPWPAVVLCEGGSAQSGTALTNSTFLTYEKIHVQIWLL